MEGHRVLRSVLSSEKVVMRHIKGANPDGLRNHKYISSYDRLGHTRC